MTKLERDFLLYTLDLCRTALLSKDESRVLRSNLDLIARIIRTYQAAVSRERAACAAMAARWQADESVRERYPDLATAIRDRAAFAVQKRGKL